MAVYEITLEAACSVPLLEGPSITERRMVPPVTRRGTVVESNVLLSMSRVQDVPPSLRRSSTSCRAVPLSIGVDRVPLSMGIGGVPLSMGVQ